MYFGAWPSLSNNSGIGKAGVSSEGPWGTAIDILVALLFRTALYALVLVVCQNLPQKMGTINF